MLLLARRPDQGVVLKYMDGLTVKEIRVVVVGRKKERIYLGFEAPAEVQILRDELLTKAKS